MTLGISEPQRMFCFNNDSKSWAFSDSIQSPWVFKHIRLVAEQLVFMMIKFFTSGLHEILAPPKCYLCDFDSIIFKYFQSARMQIIYLCSMRVIVQRINTAFGFLKCCISNIHVSEVTKYSETKRFESNILLVRLIQNFNFLCLKKCCRARSMS